jgi:hypothetical protein
MGNSESEIQQLVQIEAAKHGCILLRNNSGALRDDTGRVVRFGLGNVSKQHQDQIKSSDLIGITSVVVTSDMVGKRLGIFTAVEVKRKGKTLLSDKRVRAQKAFIDWVISLGGIAGFAESVEDLKALLGK